MSLKLSEELLWRGFVQDSTYDDLTELDVNKIVFYHGYDASADSQTIGNLAAMMVDKLLLKHGHKAIILAGGATSMIGDPGGKDKERILQDEKTIEHNIKMAEKQFHTIFQGTKFTLVNNLDWLSGIGLLDFLRDIGKHYSMTPLVQRDYIAKRIGGDGISYTEFSYTLLQGYDYLHLYDKYGCTLQIGGSDQWGNCLSGVELIRKVRSVNTHVLTLPLVIDTATGKKFGKSEDGAVWLDENKTSAFKFYQFWLNVDDAGVETYLKIYTELEKPEVDQIISEFSVNKSERLAQKTLAFEVTSLVHGQKRAEEVRKVSEVLFSDANFLDLEDKEKNILKDELGVVADSGDLAQTLVDASLASSKKEARTFLSSGAISVNGQKVTDDHPAIFVKGLNLVKRGRNKFALISDK